MLRIVSVLSNESSKGSFSLAGVSRLALGRPAGGESKVRMAIARQIKSIYRVGSCYRSRPDEASIVMLCRTSFALRVSP